MSETDPLELLRAICMRFPEAEEKLFGGHTHPTFRVRDKMFAMYHEADGQRIERTSAWFKGAPGAQEMLIDADPGRFFAPPYLGPKGWIGVYLEEAVDWDAVAELAFESYCLVAPKRLAAEARAEARPGGA